METRKYNVELFDKVIFALSNLFSTPKRVFSFGEKEDGQFVRILCNGKPTVCRTLVWDREDVLVLQKIGKRLAETHFKTKKASS